MKEKRFCVLVTETNYCRMFVDAKNAAHAEEKAREEVEIHGTKNLDVKDRDISISVHEEVHE